MKKLVSMLCALALVLSMAGCSGKESKGVSGTFTGTAKGFGGDVTVTLTLEDSKIVDCTAEGKDETQGIGSVAIEKLPAEIAKNNSVGVDVIATATFTSNGILEAAKAALTSAGLNPDDYMTVGGGEVKDASYDADIVIVGAGGAGMTAAITAADEGKTVIVVESQAMVGGNSVRATGGLNATKTAAQDKNEFAENAGVEKTLDTAAKTYADNTVITELAKTVKAQYDAYLRDSSDKGYFDSVELMELDTMIGGKGINNFELVKTLCENSADAIDARKTALR